MNKITALFLVPALVLVSDPEIWRLIATLVVGALVELGKYWIDRKKQRDK